MSQGDSFESAADFPNFIADSFCMTLVIVFKSAIEISSLLQSVSKIRS
jgi:hypothetical protein